MIRSLRGRLLLGTTLAMTAVSCALGLGVYLSIRQSLLREFDATMASKAQSLAALIEQGGGKVKVEFEATQMPEFSGGRHAEYFELWQDDGAVLLRSPSLAQKDLERRPTEQGAWDVLLSDGRAGREVQLKVKPRAEGEDGTSEATSQRSVTLAVARERREMDHVLERMGWMLTGLCGLAIIVSDVTLVWLVKQAMRPVDALTLQIEAMEETNLGQRVGVPGLPSELEGVSDRLNGLLDRLDKAFARERAFSADAAHELRTPLAGLQTTLEVCGSKLRTPTEYAAALGKCLKIVEPMQKMVEGLLLLARADAGQLPLVLEPVEMAELVEECWGMFAGQAEAKKLRVTQKREGSCIVQSDREKLRIVLRNLLCNATAYTDEGGRVDIEVRGEPGGVVLSVANTGSEVAEEDVPKLFQRFWRGDVARGGIGEHCGLGLSLCQRLVELLGGTIEVRTKRGGWFDVIVGIGDPRDRQHPEAHGMAHSAACVR